MIPDYSYISTISQCGRLAYYKYELGLTAHADQSPYLLMGKALHAGLDWLYTHDWDVEGACAVAAEKWGNYRIPETHKAKHLTAGHAQIILRNYAEDRAGDAIRPIRFRPDQLNIDTDSLHLYEDGTVRLVETPLSIALTSAEQYGGLIDLPAEVNGIPAVIDHKSTGAWVGDAWARKYAMSHQLRGYVLIMRELTGLKINRAYVNGIYTGKEAADDLSAWKKRSSARSRLFGPFLYSEQHLEETRQWAMNWLRVRELYRTEGFWPQNDRACVSFAGGCEFYDVCRTSPHVRAAILKRDFTRRELTGVLASGADSDD